MSDEGFLKRWSRRKRTEAPAAEPNPTAKPLLRPSAENVAQPTPAAPAEAEEAIDPATLPPLETLGADSDYTMFLKKGVPEPLRIAALRKAWMSDPFIRDFRGPAEYALDYTTSEFDLLPTDDVAKLLARIFTSNTSDAESAPAEKMSGVEAEAAADAATPPDAATARLTAAPAASSLTNPTPMAGETQPAPSSDPSPSRRKHGGAMPS